MSASLPKTTIFVLRATGENPDYTKAYLQACMEEYINLKKQMAARTSDTTIAGLTEQLLRLEPELQKCDNEMQVVFEHQRRGAAGRKPAAWADI